MQVIGTKIVQFSRLIMIIILKNNLVKTDGSWHAGIIWSNNKEGRSKVPYLENIIERVGR